MAYCPRDTLLLKSSPWWHPKQIIQLLDQKLGASFCKVYLYLYSVYRPNITLQFYLGSDELQHRPGFPQIGVSWGLNCDASYLYLRGAELGYRLVWRLSWMKNLVFILSPSKKKMKIYIKIQI